jgi:hypothetical protein
MAGQASETYMTHEDMHRVQSLHSTHSKSWEGKFTSKGRYQELQVF